MVSSEKKKIRWYFYFSDFSTKNKTTIYNFTWKKWDYAFKLVKNY